MSSTTASPAADEPAPTALGWRCVVCGAELPISTALPWRCPNASSGDWRHALRVVRDMSPMRPSAHERFPFVAWDAELAWAGYAAAHGMSRAARSVVAMTIDAKIVEKVGTSVSRTPMHRSAELSHALAFSPRGGVWVKDETGNLAGSHKARHLVPVLLQLLTSELLDLAPWSGVDDRPPLAIASCGNAALAAATLAEALSWPLTVFLPPAANPAVVAEISAMGAGVVVCPRLSGDPPGDPCMHRFREAVDRGAIPFTVQGTENALALDGGRTLGWEIVEHLGHAIDRIVVQVGGGALATGVGAACAVAGVHPRLHAVQTEGCAPLRRAWDALDGATMSEASARWSQLMVPWPTPRSAAEGIIDDETYDWLGVVDAMRSSGGRPVVVPEETVLHANALAQDTTGIAVSVTGSAGLAGLIEMRDEVDDDERVVVIFSGAERATR